VGAVTGRVDELDDRAVGLDAEDVVALLTADVDVAVRVRPVEGP